MREILFRGKRKDNGEWEYGNLIISPYLKNCVMIERLERKNGYFGTTAVNPETVGQYTGLTDKNGKKIFEGDILQNIGYGEVINRCVIGYGIYDSFGGSDGTVGFYLCWQNDKKQERKYSNVGFWVNVREAVCIGNIHDNHDLLD